MANEALNKSSFYNGETISGEITITVDIDDPAVPAIDVLNAGLQFILKEPNKTDAEAIANLTVGNGITVISNSNTLITATYSIPGVLTRDLLPPANEKSVTLEYEINITYTDDSQNSDVLEIGSIKIRPRVKDNFTGV